MLEPQGSENLSNADRIVEKQARPLPQASRNIAFFPHYFLHARKR